MTTQAEEKLTLQEAERAYYALSKQARYYESPLPPNVDREWRELLAREQRAKDICNAIRFKRGMRPIWP